MFISLSVPERAKEKMATLGYVNLTTNTEQLVSCKKKKLN